MPQNIPIHLIKFHANRTVHALEHDSVRQERRLQVTKKHLNDCINNPTQGMIAFKDEYAKVKDFETFNKNARKMDINEEIMPLRLKLKQKVLKLYPKTFMIRSYIANTHRVVFDKVLHVKHNFKRLLFKMFLF